METCKRVSASLALPVMMMDAMSTTNSLLRSNEDINPDIGEQTRLGVEWCNYDSQIGQKVPFRTRNDVFLTDFAQI